MSDEPLRIAVIAGEPSGDRLAASILAALRDACGRPLDLTGIGGPALAAQGLASLHPMADLANIGLLQVLARAPRLLRAIDRTADAIRRHRPQLFLSVDVPDFSFRVAARLGRGRFPLAHCVAPSVWAWRAGRAAKLARLYDRLLCLLPFEPAWFLRHGLDARFIGHPALDRPLADADADRFRATLGLSSDRPVVAVLAGSRERERRRLLPIFRAAVALAQERLPPFTVVLPTLDEPAGIERQWPGAIAVRDERLRFDAMAAAQAALVASGTATLELALLGVPHAVAYRLDPVSAFAARRLLRVPHVALSNLLAARPAVPECLQGECAPGALAENLSRVIMDPDLRARQLRSFADIRARLGSGEPPAAERAARALLELISP